VEEFLGQWGYLGIFLGLVGTGIGFPMPEEVPVVLAGCLAATHDELFWFVMLPVCIAGVIVGDGLLYGIGRLWGPRLLQFDWINRRVFPPDRLVAIERNFERYGVKLLLFARLTPGIRAPIFFTAGMTRLPLNRFIFADSLYAVPGVSALFFLGWWFGGSMLVFIKGLEYVKSVIGIVVVVAVAVYLLYRALRQPAVTGNPSEMPPLVEQVTHKLEQVTTKLMHPMTGHGPQPPPTIDGSDEAIHQALPPAEPRTK